MKLITSHHLLSIVEDKLIPEPEFPYIATPFSAKGIGAERKMLERYQMAVLISSILFRENRPHYAPIVSTYAPSKILKNPADSSFWTKLDETSLKRCDGLWVIMMPGWASSKGIKKEINLFLSLVEQDTEGVGYVPFVRFYPLKSFLEGDLGMFQIMEGQQHLLQFMPQPANT